MEVSWIWIWYLPVFFLGASVGSFLNVVVARVPTERSIFWPSSRCFKCLQPIRWMHNIPILGYLVLRGKCGHCKQSFSSRYLWVELATGLIFVALFYAEIAADLRGLGWTRRYPLEMRFGLVPLSAWVDFVVISVLVCFLLAASLCDIEHLEIPLPITVTGTLVGIAFSMAFAWPFPLDNPIVVSPPGWADLIKKPQIPIGTMPWPFFFPLPSWAVPHGPLLGLVNAMLGAVAGALLCRVVRWVYAYGRGIEGMGIGDSDLMMMAGSFLGWQVVLVGFFLAVIPGIVLGVGQLLFRGTQVLPYGPSLALGCMLAFYGWGTIGPLFAPLLLDPFLLGAMGIAAVLVLGVCGVVFRFLGGENPAPG